MVTTKELIMTLLRVTSAIVGMAILVAASAATAQDPRPGRYTMHKTDDGFVRLDTDTGAVSLCRKTSSGWGCNAISDASPSMGPSHDGPRSNGGPPPYSGPENLAAQNAELKAEIQRLEELLELRGSRKPPAAGKNGSFKLPTEGEVDQALDYFERMLKKFQERLKRLEKGTEKPQPRQL